jgi:nitrogen regulatory protein PII
MKMLVIIFRHSLEQDLLELLKEVDVKAFTEAPKVQGAGETGSTSHSFGWPGHNSMILAAMEEDHADRVVKRLKTFRDTLARRQHGAKIPMRLFAFPCECLI